MYPDGGNGHMVRQRVTGLYEEDKLEGVGTNEHHF